MGQSFFECGVWLIFSSFFFLKEESDLEIEKLEKSLEVAKQSVGAGLAFGYFNNYLKSVAKRITDL